MMNNLRLAAMAIMIVVVAPIIVGYAWPVDTETVDTWETVTNTDITASIADRDIPIIDSYAGPMNHYWLYDSAGGYTGYSPVGYSSSPSSIPKLTYTATVESITVNPYVIVPSHYSSNYRTDFICPVGSMSVDLLDGTSYSCTTVVYLPSSNSYHIMGTGHHGEVLKASDVDTVSIQGASAVTPKLLTTRTYTVAEGEYVDMSTGFVFDGQYGNLEWFNGLDNHIVEIWLRSASIVSGSSITGGGATAALTVSGGTVYVGAEALGSTTAYPYISLVFDHDEGTVEVRGIIGASSFTDSTWQIGNTVTTDTTVSMIKTLTMSGYFEYEVKRAYSEIGTGRGIDSAVITPYSWFPHYAWQLDFSSPARFGESMTIGSTTYPVEDGAITITDLDGEEWTIPIRGMAVLSLLFDDDGPQQNETWQHIYVNGHEVEAGYPSTSLGVTLNGYWYVQVTVSDVVQKEQTNYIWSIGSFGLDRTSFCTVGLLSCLAVAVGAGLWGKKDGAKAALILFCMIVAGASYLVLM